jgi:multiple sugar transport system ATP-binding protein
VRQNLAFPVRALSAAARERAIDDAVQRFRLRGAEQELNGVDSLTPNFLNQKVLTLSGGQKQRVALARCFVRDDRSLFVLDEPFDGQDNPLRQFLLDDLRDRIQEEREKSRTGVDAAGFLIVTHMQHEALSLADRIAFLHANIDGSVQILASAPPNVLYRQPPNLAIATFLGDPAMNLLQAVAAEDCLIAGSIRVAWADLCVQRPSFGRKLRIGWRPEDIELSRPELPGLRLHGVIGSLRFEGEESIVTVRCEELPEVSFRVQLEGFEELPAPASRVEFNCPFARAHLFDADTGARLIDV